MSTRVPCATLQPPSETARIYRADRITGCYDGGSHGEGPAYEAAVRHAWAIASNATQWKSPA